jgi:subtilisin family serine protease
MPPMMICGPSTRISWYETTFGLMIVRFSGPNPGLMKVVNFGSGEVSIDEFATNSGTSWGHSAAQGGLGVGAANFRDAPAFAVNPPLIEAFSSAGGTPILFDTAGNRLPAAQVRQQPGITAPDGVNTVSFGVFFGTSAAAPHAAAVAALMKELVPTLTPDATYEALKGTAIDMDDPSTWAFDTGFDFGTDFGLIQADKATNAVAPEPEPIPPEEPEEPTGPRPEPIPPRCILRFLRSLLRSLKDHQ